MAHNPARMKWAHHQGWWVGHVNSGGHVNRRAVRAARLANRLGVNLRPLQALEMITRISALWGTHDG